MSFTTTSTRTRDSPRLNGYALPGVSSSKDYESPAYTTPTIITPDSADPESHHAHDDHSHDHHDHHHDHGHHSHGHAPHHDHHHHPGSAYQMGGLFSKIDQGIAQFLLDRFGYHGLLGAVLSDKDSRKLFYFINLNFCFMLLQTFYGFVTGSLGLISDSIHMLFDCLAMLLGLAATVLAKRPPNQRFPYGFGKMDTVAGFGNGVFLILISLEILVEAIERLFTGAEVKRIGELLVVSTLGLLVNLVGVFVIGHQHAGHSHGHSHSHSHAHHEESPDPSQTPSHGRTASILASLQPSFGSMPTSPFPFISENESPLPQFTSSSSPAPDRKVANGHCHSNHHHSPHSHDDTPAPTHLHHGHHDHSDNMLGIYLHILADTMGSVSVILSTILIHYFGWPGFDPIASCIIAILILLSALPLIKSSGRTLLLSVPSNAEYSLRDALTGVSGLRGVDQCTAPRFWMNELEGSAPESDPHDYRGKLSNPQCSVLGVLHIVATRGANLEDVRGRAKAFLAARDMSLTVQVEGDGVTNCWCGSGKAAGSVPSPTPSNLTPTKLVKRRD